MIFNIQRYSTHDGSGIRTIIFYKGCPLRCQWCSNPEGLSFGYDLMYDRRICRNFEDCIRADDKVIRRTHQGIDIYRTRLRQPEKFSAICASKALTVSGEVKNNQELLSEIERDIPFYREDGGVTLSGGEPLSQGPDLTVLLKECKRRAINVCIETSLHVAWEKVERCLGLVSTFLVDLKHTDRDKFNRYTQGNIELVMENLHKLTAANENVIIRIPVIPGFNHSVPEMKNILDFAASLKNIKEVHFLPYHSLGTEKYNMLGMDYLFGNKKQVLDSELTGYIRTAKSLGLHTKIGG